VHSYDITCVHHEIRFATVGEANQQLDRIPPDVWLPVSGFPFPSAGVSPKRRHKGGARTTTRWVSYQPVPAIIDPLRWVPSIEPSFGASP
jgi:hypothetical protein